MNKDEHDIVNTKNDINWLDCHCWKLFTDSITITIVVVVVVARLIFIYIKCVFYWSPFYCSCWCARFKMNVIIVVGMYMVMIYFLCFPFTFIRQLLQYHLPFGTVLRSTQATWNHSISHYDITLVWNSPTINIFILTSELSQATMSPKETCWQ